MKKIIILMLFLGPMNLYALNISFIDTATDKGLQFYNSIYNNKDYLRAIFVGDVLLSRYVANSVYKNFNGDYKSIFSYVESFLQGADIVFGNLENPVTEERMTIRDNIDFLLRTPVEGVNSLVNICCSFGAEAQALDSLKWAGFNVVNIANNHLGDGGVKGIEDTVYNLREIDLNYVGGGLDAYEAHEPYVYNKNNIKIGILGYSNIRSSRTWEATETKAGIAMVDHNTVNKDIKLTKSVADIVIVSMHFGEEGDVSPDPNEIEIAHSIIDSGANIVIGHHPHVVLPIEVYSDGLVAYSLGNFVFDEDSYDKSAGLLLELFINKDKKIYVIPRNVIINYAHQPIIQF
jgi:poly-gamma-glutamate synthesis protein (capsule biosynthesis protein)